MCPGNSWLKSFLTRLADSHNQASLDHRFPWTSLFQTGPEVRHFYEKLGSVVIDNPKIIYPPKERVQESMETLIHHFLLASEGFDAPKGEVYNSIEAPKGELGFYIYSAGGPKPYRLKIRSPSFVNLQSLEMMCVGHMLADVVAVIGSLDVVLGEIDR